MPNMFTTSLSNQVILNSEQICSSHWSCCDLSFSFPPSDIFSMISDSSGVMVYGRYDMFLREVLKLPTAVFEGPSFGYTEQSAKSCFSQQVNEETQGLNHPSEEAKILPVLHIGAYLPRKHRAGWGKGPLCWFLVCRFGAFNRKLVSIGSPYNHEERGLVKKWFRAGSWLTHS